MLSNFNTPQLKSVVAETIAVAPVEKIFLLAVQTSFFQNSTIFKVPAGSREEVVHYHLLVLLESNRQRNNEAWQDMIEHRCRAHTPVTAWVLTVARFIEWLDAGQPFATRVYRDGFLCHDAGDIPLPEPLPDEEGMEEDLRAECIHYMNRSAEFLDGSDHYCLRRQYRPAAFLLHQAAEQAYIAVIWRVTGFRPMVHSLEKLHRYALPFSSALASVFPLNNEKEESIFKLLQKSYIDTRYTAGFTMQEQDLISLSGRVRKLQEIAEAFCA